MRPVTYFVVALAVLAGAHAAHAQVEGTRSLPQSCRSGEEAVVNLDLHVVGAVPNGVIVAETLPAGSTLQSATPPPGRYNQITRELRWVFYGGAVNDGDMDIQYTLVTGGTPAAFSGSALFNDPTGVPQQVSIAGDQLCAGPPVCIGDCDGDGAVTIDDILYLITIPLGGGDIQTCAAGDADGSGTVTVDEIVTAVNNALNGCGE